ncbi:hypothetical protein ACH5RR_001563 [Cinchona calisaya]|uniref:Uncharacterized protein n=1 Tax=Cinchona calisaya TaxID=153742 RepID=A0ABD3B4Z5_9GENT
MWLFLLSDCELATMLELVERRRIKVSKKVSGQTEKDDQLDDDCSSNKFGYDVNHLSGMPSSYSNTVQLEGGIGATQAEEVAAIGGGVIVVLFCRLHVIG